ncbi:hypothetical protein NP233_g1236 [Leucocoprinus birnbaumii]|uniref:Uncharacterized protein n=1 Tax=Leucocoprinus birnbaumii TaxID=56174 RepID=A0AAD5W0R8_9AGAR|nr:hypothetical protein NP233_g1236 [Leucocoprinus birnbaumii]
MPDYHLLPPELWLEILSWAIHPPAREQDAHCIDYAPFQPAPMEPRDSTLVVKRTLRMVCRLWRHWTDGSFFRAVKIQPGSNALWYAFSAAQNQQNYGELVQRATLPYPSTVSGPANSFTSMSIQILRRCKQLKVLIRPPCLLAQGLHFDFEVDCVPLPSLRRLEWWHHAEAERSGGINSLCIVLQHAPDIEYLFIGGVVGYTHFAHVCLSSLRTLRLHLVNGLLLHQIVSRWLLPSLTHIILDSPLVERGLQSVWDRFGYQLEVVEFGKHLRFFMYDHLTTCIRGCSTLQEFGYFIFFTKPPTTLEGHPTIRTIRLNSAINNVIHTAEEIWAILEGHFQFYRRLESLQRIILYGQWRGILAQQRFHEILKRLRERQGNVILRLADGTVIDGYPDL